MEVQQTSGPTLEDIQASIIKYKKEHEQLLLEQKDLVDKRDQNRKMAQEFRRRTDTMIQNLEEEKRLHKDTIETEKATMKLLQQQEAELRQELLMVEAALKEEEVQKNHLKEQSEVFTAVPERPVYFNGQMVKPTGVPIFDVEPRIVYPMEGGTMLITFEEEVVANKILDLKKHQVDLGGECSITVEARPVQLMVPRRVEIDSEVCPQRILISRLPKMDAETLLNKLEIHFSKKKHGGGEVEQCELMADSWTVVLTFVEKDVARSLTDKEDHEVYLRNKKHQVKVTPYLNGRITDLKTEMAVCPRTVLLSGIPDVMERETLQDVLEIYFQKSSNGGGEIQAVLYSPLGQNATALFDGASAQEGGNQ